MGRRLLLLILRRKIKMLGVSQICPGIGMLFGFEEREIEVFCDVQQSSPGNIVIGVFFDQDCLLFVPR